MDNRKIPLLLFALMVFLLAIPNTITNAQDTEDNLFYLGAVVNTGKDTGYSENNAIKEDDPHFGWTLGRFCVSGFTRVINENASSPVFLKNVGDRVTLWFHLDQDIDHLQ